MRKQTVLLADDHPDVTEIVATLLEPTFDVVGKVHDGQALVEAATDLKPAVIITDISMPILNGIEAVSKLSACGCTSKIIFLTVHSDPDFIHVCLATRALGYVVKHRMAKDLLPAIREAFAGHTFVSPTLHY